MSDNLPTLLEHPWRYRGRTAARIAAIVAIVLALVSLGSLHVVVVAGLVVAGLNTFMIARANPVGDGLVAIVATLLALLILAGSTMPSVLPIGVDWAGSTVLLVAALTLLVQAFATKPIGRVALGVGGLTLGAVAGTAIFVKLIGIFDLLGPRSLGAVPLGLIGASLLLGAAFLLLSWGEEPTIARFPGWLPAAVGVAGVVASVFLWRAMVLREESDLARQSTIVASRAAQAVRREVDNTRNVLRQFAIHEADPVSDSLALVALTQLRPDVPAATVLAVLDSNGLPRVALPDIAAAEPIARAVPVRSIARVQGQAPVAVLPIPNDTARLVVHAARCEAGACRGGVAAIITSQRLLQRATNELTADWTVDIGAPRPGTSTTAAHSRIVPLDLGGPGWQLVSTPTPATIGTLRSTLPEVALILGLILSALLSVTVRLNRRAMESARAVERLRLATALDRSTDAIWEWDIPAGSLVRSPHLWRYMGFDPESRSQTLDEWLELIHPDDRDHVTAELREHVAKESDAFEAEYRVATPNGSWHTVVDRGRAVERDAAGVATRMLGITADVTRARQSEREFREVEALTSMGRVAARVAHEINNPLAGIRSAFRLVKDAVPGDHPHYRYVGAIEREVERIATVTRGLYETYRPEHEDGDTAVVTVVGDAVALLTEMNRKAQVNVETQLDGVPSVVPLRGALLRQIVYNLVQNAIDASPVGGTVTLSARMNGRGLVLEVDDEGEGVPEPLRDRIFEPFFTTRGSSAENSGMGLGLSMVSRSVMAAGGSIAVDDAPSGGARFVVTLPCEPSPN